MIKAGISEELQAMAVPVKSWPIELTNLSVDQI